MTGEQAKQAFKSQVRVVHNCRGSGSLIVYHRIIDYTYEIRSDRKLYLVLGLTDEKERCLVYADPRDVAIYDENKELTYDNYFKNSRQLPQRVNESEV